MNDVAQTAETRPQKPRTIPQLCEDARQAVAALAEASRGKARPEKVTDLETAARIAVNVVESAVANTIADVVARIMREHGIFIAPAAGDVTGDYAGPVLHTEVDLGEAPALFRAACDRLYRAVLDLKPLVHAAELKRADKIEASAKAAFLDAHEAMAEGERYVNEYNIAVFGDAFFDDEATAVDNVSAAAAE